MGVGRAEQDSPPVYSLHLEVSFLHTFERLALNLALRWTQSRDFPGIVLSCALQKLSMGCLWVFWIVGELLVLPDFRRDPGTLESCLCGFSL